MDYAWELDVLMVYVFSKAIRGIKMIGGKVLFIHENAYTLLQLPGCSIPVCQEIFVIWIFITAKKESGSIVR